MAEKIDRMSGSILDDLIKVNGEIYKIDDAFEWVVEKLQNNLEYEVIKFNINKYNNLINTSWELEVYKGDDLKWSMGLNYEEFNSSEATYSVFKIDSINDSFLHLI